MGNLDPKKMAGYTLILGPILALVCFFIQPGGVLQIGGSAEPLDYAGQMKISSDNSGLGIITGILVPVGLITLFSGIMFYIQSMEGGNGFGLARIGLPFFLIATAGWTLASSIFIGFSSEISTNIDLAGLAFGINIISSISFGIGGMILALAASTRNEVNKNISYLAFIAATIVFLTNFILPFSPESGTLFQGIAGICFIIYTVWSILIGRALTK